MAALSPLLPESITILIQIHITHNSIILEKVPSLESTEASIATLNLIGKNSKFYALPYLKFMLCFVDDIVCTLHFSRSLSSNWSESEATNTAFA